MKEKSYNREFIKKKKSQEAFLTKPKFNPYHYESVKMVQPRKSQPRISNSSLEITPKDAFKRMASLQIQPSQLSTIQQHRVAKPHQKIKKTIENCWSERHNTILNEANKRQKPRRFSSNSDLKPGQEIKQSHKRKLSLVEVQQVFESNKKIKKIDKLNAMTWLIIIRKLYVDEYLLRTNKAIQLNLIENYLNKIQNEHFQQFKLLIDPLDYELKLSKDNILAILKNFFTIPKAQLKDSKDNQQNKIAFYEIQNCFMQHQLKNMITGSDKNQIKSSSSEEQPVQTARFQEGNANEEHKKKKILESKSYIQNIVPKINNYKTFSKNNKEYLKFAGKSSNEKTNQALSSNSASGVKSIQSLNPNFSPFITGENTPNEASLGGVHKEKGQMIFKKGSFQYDKDKQESLGMITLQEKSPCYLRGSELFDLIQKENSNLGKNNISFSTEHIQIESNLTLENAVSYFQEILKKNAIMLKDSAQDDESSLKEQNSHEIRKFLEQLINYRLSMTSQGFSQDIYSYFVSFQNLECRQPYKKVMRQLLQNIYMKVYFNSLQGLKIKNSLSFLKSINNHIHPGIRILNISHNNISNLSFILQEISLDNQMEFLNINHNNITDIGPILLTFPKLKELHCQGNIISIVKSDHYKNDDLGMIDLSYNKIQKESSLVGLVKITSLNIINLMHNPLTNADWKWSWSNSLEITKIYQMQNLYVMSGFGHQKDIAFSIQKKKRSEIVGGVISDKEDINDYNTKQFDSTSEQFLKINVLLNKENIRGIQKVVIREMPKQKISNIKAFIDGRAI